MGKGLARLTILIATLFALAACKTTGSGGMDVGSGPITLSRQVQVYFEQYKTYDFYGYFAVSTDGKNYGISGCRELGGCWNDGRAMAVRQCRERSGGVPCKIYADGQYIVWQGATGAGKKFATVKAVPGNGQLSISSYAQQSIKRYFALDDPVALAISENGNYTYALKCTDSPCLGSGGREAAVAVCNDRSRGSPCYLYAVGRKVVWNGPVEIYIRPPSYTPPPPPKVEARLKGVRCYLDGGLVHGLSQKDCAAQGGEPRP